MACKLTDNLPVHKMNQELIDQVLKQIDIDILQYADTTALEELLKSCPVEALKSYLPEPEWVSPNT